MSEENGNIQIRQMPFITRINEDGTLVYDIPAAAAVPGSWIDLETGLIVFLKEVDGANVTAEYALHPVIPAVWEILGKICEETDKGALGLRQVFAMLGTLAPQMTAATIDAMLTEAMPWPTELALAQLRAGRPVEGWGGSQTPQINVSIQTPQINLPEQAAPVVNIQSRLEMPVTEETVNVERDANGFISSATKIRAPIG